MLKVLKPSGWPGQLLLTAHLVCWFCPAAVSRERWQSWLWDAKGIRTHPGETGFPGLELFARGLGHCTNTEKKLKSKEEKCPGLGPKEKSCLGAAWVRAVGRVLLRAGTQDL